MQPVNNILNIFNDLGKMLRMFISWVKLWDIFWQFNPLLPSNDMWWQNLGQYFSGNGGCLATPSHYLKQCCIIIMHVLWHLPVSQFHKKCSSIKSLTYVWRLHLEFAATSPGSQWVNVWCKFVLCHEVMHSITAFCCIWHIMTTLLCIKDAVFTKLFVHHTFSGHDIGMK